MTGPFDRPPTQANPDEDLRGDGRVGSSVGLGLLILAVIVAVLVIVGLLVWVMASPP